MLEEELEGEEDMSEAESIVLNESENIEKRYISKDFEFEDAESWLNELKEFDMNASTIDDSLTHVQTIEDSRQAFSEGETFMNDGEIHSAISQFQDVNEKDEGNYEQAQEHINELSQELESDSLNEAKQLANEEDFEEAVNVLEKADRVLDDNDDIATLLDEYDKRLAENKEQERIEEMKKAKSDQLVVVQESNIVEQSAEHKALYPDMLQMILRNESDKTIENMEVRFLVYDEDGYPVKTRPSMSVSGKVHEFRGNAESINVQPGETFGRENGWEIESPHDAEEVLSVVKTVDFYDGTTWDNPYYDYWIEEYKDEPLGD
ncbi:DUF5780 domain-containing protein [Alkalibacillus salilacus]|uniref:Tetratricopeptide (TPR) repeat protein n=1 Tax=Alkalibacillus salilacus TaxID=284582 RepID=A0ABT9VI62_9BACI|nr:DUF5780 domain-containing protein [Alkalibacillus salilacus]MDQ0160661.1 tetratricopeptide (TPR) repeat protein [Alkalibacillus salilacus]